MSAPRRIARHLLALTLALIAVELLVVGFASETPRGVLLVLAACAALQTALCVGWWLRTQGHLRSRFRHALWMVGAAVYGLSVLGGLVSGLGPVVYGLVAALGVAALGFAVGGAVAEQRRTNRRLTFVERGALS